MTLPDKTQSRATLNASPLDVRVMLAGMPKAGKTTLAASWAPTTTLIVDTQRGTTLLHGEHYVAHVNDWTEFQTVVDDLAAGGHQYRTVMLDLVDDLWTFADAHFAGKNAVLASATDDWQRSIKTAEGMFRQTIGKLLASSMGVWFIGHTRDKQDGQLVRYVPKLDSRPLSYVQGACEVILLAETLGTKRLLHTAPSAKFEAGSRMALPEPMDLDARALFDAMDRDLNPAKYQTKAAANGAAPRETVEV